MLEGKDDILGIKFKNHETRCSTSLHAPCSRIMSTVHEWQIVSVAVASAIRGD